MGEKIKSFMVDCTVKNMRNLNGKKIEYNSLIIKLIELNKVIDI